MAKANLGEVLSELGWQSGFRIPVANEENKRLEEEIERKMKLKASLNAELESTEERIKMMKKHASNLTVQRDMNQKLLTAHSTQLETEDYQYKLSCNTESSLRKEMRNFEKEWQEVNEVVSNIERDLAKMVKKIEESKKAVKFDESSLQKWEEILQKNEEDNQLIEKYAKEDAKKYKELELKRQKLSVELESYRQAVIRTTDEAREMQIVLDRTAKLYSQSLQERRQMINQWKESVAVLRQRDDDIEKILREIETLREVTREKKNVLQESEKFLEEQIENNKKLENSNKQLEKKLAAMKEEHRKIKNTVDTYETELQIQKSTMKDLAQRTQRMRADIKQKENQIECKYEKIEKLKIQISNLATKLNDIDNQKLNIEERTKELERMIEEQEKRKAAMVKEVNRLQDASLRTTNQIKELESQNKVLEMECQSERKKSELLDTLYTKTEKTLEERKESLYHVEFEIQKLEMKLERLKGHERDKSEAERKLKKIEELQSTLDERMGILKILQKQITTLEHDMKKISNSLANDNNELERLRNKKQDLILLMEGGEKRLKVAQTRNDEKQVEESMLRLKVSQMEKMISNLGDNVYNLERYRLELEAAVRERRTEIDLQKESLIIEKRVVASECSELRNAIAERKTRIRQLQARYENCIATLGYTSEGAPMSTAYLKIQSAQERFLLQEQGDKLDETIRKTEQEIQSMENTLRVINACNDKYKANLAMADQGEFDQEEQKKLDEELRNAEEQMKRKEEELQCATKTLEKTKESYTKILKDIENSKELKEEKERYLTDLKRQINEQKEKLLRADKNLRSAQRDIQKLYASTGDNTILIQEKEVQLRELQEQNAIILQDIAEFTIRHVEAEAYVKKLLAVKNIELPSIPLPGQSPTQSQCRSVASSCESRPKSTGQTSVFASSRESIGSVINIEPQFGPSSTTISLRKDTKYEETSKRSLRIKYLSTAQTTKRSS